MAITVPSDTPQELLEQIKADITGRQVGEWEWDADGDITLSNPEYCRKAWFRLYVKDRKLIFGIVPASEPKMNPALFAFYHGRLLETLMGHYPHLAGETMTSNIVSKFYDL